MTIDMTWEHREKIIRREEREEGYNLGLTKGREEGRDEGRDEQKRADDIIIAELKAEIERLKKQINSSS